MDCLLFESLKPCLYFAVPLRRRAFVIAETELKLIASAAIMGESSCPVNGYSRPAATFMRHTGSVNGLSAAGAPPGSS